MNNRSYPVIGDTYKVADPAPGNGIPEHMRGAYVRVLDFAGDGYLRCMVRPRNQFDSHTTLLHNSQIIRS